MIPASDFELDEIDSDFEDVSYVDATYKLDFENKCIVGKVDYDDALKQAIHKIIITESEIYPIYSFGYGVNTDGVMGEGTNVALGLIQMRLEDAILNDDRFDSIEFNSVEMVDKHTIAVDMTIKKVTGQLISIKEEVNV